MFVEKRTCLFILKTKMKMKSESYGSKPTELWTEAALAAALETYVLSFIFTHWSFYYQNNPICFEKLSYDISIFWHIINEWVNKFQNPGFCQNGFTSDFNEDSKPFYSLLPVTLCAEVRLALRRGRPGRPEPSWSRWGYCVLIILFVFHNFMVYLD